MAAQTYDTVIDNKYKIGSLIGKQLIAKKQVVGHYDFHTSKNIVAFNKDAVIGTVFNYLIEPKTGKVFWAFKDARNKNRIYYVMHDVNAMGLNAIDKQTTKTVQDYVTEAKTDQEIEEKGKVIYYFEKYGKVVLGTTVGGFIVYKLITRNGK